MTTPDPADVVVLVDDRGQPTGTAPRAEVHTADTPLHLAFSCYLFDDEGRVLVTRRALTKRSWPGVWTNSFCGHPRPGESFREAVERYADHELGVRVFALSSLLPDFRYRAVDASGVVENEICPVFTARVVGTTEPNPDEVAEHRWVAFEDLRAAVTAAPWAFSPWMVDQLRVVGRPAPPSWVARRRAGWPRAEGAG
jgi:isopentenyl-diphosphate delta-isomerase